MALKSFGTAEYTRCLNGRMYGKNLGDFWKGGKFRKKRTFMKAERHLARLKTASAERILIYQHTRLGGQHSHLDLDYNKRIPLVTK